MKEAAPRIAYDLMSETELERDGQYHPHQAELVEIAATVEQTDDGGDQQYGEQSREHVGEGKLVLDWQHEGPLLPTFDDLLLLPEPRFKPALFLRRRGPVMFLAPDLGIQPPVRLVFL
jgi:hypothetical protein